MKNHHPLTSTKGLIFTLLSVFWKEGYCDNLQNVAQVPNHDNDPKIMRRIPVNFDEQFYSQIRTVVVSSKSEYLEWLPVREYNNNLYYGGWIDDFFRGFDAISWDFETMNLVAFVYGQETSCGFQGTKEIFNANNHTVTIQLSYNDEVEGASVNSYCAVFYHVSKQIRRVYMDRISIMDHSTRRTILMNQKPHLPPLNLAAWVEDQELCLWNNWKFRGDRLLQIPVLMTDPIYQDLTTVLGNAESLDHWFATKNETSIQLYEVLFALRTEPAGIYFENYNLILYQFVGKGTLEFTGIMEADPKTRDVTVYWNQDRPREYDEKHIQFHVLCYLAHKSVTTIYLDIDETIHNGEDYWDGESFTVAIPNMPGKTPSNIL
mmetsp:Transcript_46917/g.69418  ORF Transcript_46917/g.69418 Transcript_46917/m.69418 type:complete len:376 (-) Transcript_46917:208-1335(-)|eukprot:CAMPEP_0195525744 /NCGR_PEP_ID=MMETSP0794_2-20130614/26337_1 /TAXON_ID=515487 /ORGANISM="Stephanopyxis turris, Strain CCMP 815" /LENGTH=375 /DNA_ID=CAMNT_0040656267 /DNA_START=251 /DNA_END=1378 /DNA_ORIENTATION=-